MQQQYYLILPGDSEQDAFYETNLLGEDNGFGVFWSGAALSALMEMAMAKPELLEQCTIRTDMSKQTYTLAEFLERIDKLQVR